MQLFGAFSRLRCQRSESSARFVKSAQHVLIVAGSSETVLLWRISSWKRSQTDEQHVSVQKSGRGQFTVLRETPWRFLPPFVKHRWLNSVLRNLRCLRMFAQTDVCVLMVAVNWRNKKHESIKCYCFLPKLYFYNFYFLLTPADFYFQKCSKNCTGV